MMDIKVFKTQPIETDSTQHYEENICNLQELNPETQFPKREPVQEPPHIPQAFTRSSKSNSTLTFYAADNAPPVSESVKESNFERVIVASSESLHFNCLENERGQNEKCQRHIVSPPLVPVPAPKNNIQHNVQKPKRIRKKIAVAIDDAGKKYKCDQCSRLFVNDQHLTVHLVSVHGRDKHYKCDECGKTWPTRGKLNEHRISHTTATPHICHVCSAEFKRPGGLRQHTFSVHSNSTEDVARKLVIRQKRKPKIQNRKLASLPPPPPSTSIPVDGTPGNTGIKIDWTNKCKVCFQTFKGITALKLHMTVVHSTDKEKAFQCTLKNCLKKFPTRRKLQVHSCFVHGQKNDAIKVFKCEFCTSKFECKAHLELHIVDKHVEDKEFKCSVCSKTFIDQESLTKHKMSSHNSKRLLKDVCDVCSQIFKDPKTLARHLASVHMRLFYCRKCQHSFDGESDFDQHLDFQVTRHGLSLEIKFKCQLCSVSFNSQCNLNTHNRSHTRVLDVKPRNFKALNRKH